MAVHAALVMFACVFLFSIWHHHALKTQCGYCSGRWGRHDVHCPYKDIK